MQTLSTRRIATAAAFCLSASLFALLPAAAQTSGLSPVQDMKFQSSQPKVFESSPADIESFRSLIVRENILSRNMDWDDLVTDSQGIRLEGLELDSDFIGDFKAERFILSGIRAVGEAYVIEHIRMENVTGEESNGETFSADSMSFGPFEIDPKNPEKSSLMLSGDQLPDNAALFNLTFEDKIDAFSIEFIGWQPSETGDGFVVGLSNMAGTSVDPELDSPMSLSLGELTMDGIDADSIAHLANYGNDISDFDPGQFNFRDASFKNVFMQDEEIDMSFAGGAFSKSVNGPIHTQNFDLDTIRFGFKNLDEAEMAEIISMLGTDELVLRGSFHSTYNADTEILNAKDNFFELQDWFNFGLSYEMSGMNEAAYLENSSFAEILQGLDDNNKKKKKKDDGFPGEIDSISLQMTDLSGVDKLIDIYARTESIGANEARQQMIAMISLFTMMPGETPELTELTRSAGNALTKFISSGGTLTFDMDPEPALGSKEIDKLSESKDPFALFERMGMRIGHVEEN